MKRREIFAGNWKMYKDYQGALDLAGAVINGIDKKEGREYIIFPPSPYLRDVSRICGNLAFTGAQNMYFEKEGAFTGEISSGMVKDCGCRYILIGHSERRHVFGESDGDVNKKIKAAFDAGLEPVLCIGELLAEREKGETEKVLKRQINGAFKGIDKSRMDKVIIAYEPVWAIGTGKVATPEMAEEAHVLIRDIIKSIYNSEISEMIPLLYGGSVKPDNIRGLYKMANIDGVLVGGASLEAESFLAIINI
jgi:triosephosphate isomerase